MKNHIWTNQRKCLSTIQKLALLTLCLCTFLLHDRIAIDALSKNDSYSSSCQRESDWFLSGHFSVLCLPLWACCCHLPPQPFSVGRQWRPVIVARSWALPWLQSVIVTLTGQKYVESRRAERIQGKPEKSGSYTANWPQCWHNCRRAPASTLAGKKPTEHNGKVRSHLFHIFSSFPYLFRCDTKTTLCSVTIACMLLPLAIATKVLSPFGSATSGNNRLAHTVPWKDLVYLTNDGNHCFSIVHFLYNDWYWNTDSPVVNLWFLCLI